MTLQFVELQDGSGRIAVTKVDGFVEAGGFFLDFSRPIKVGVRWFGIFNSRFGFPVGLIVPVVHQGEKQGEYAISVHRSDPLFVPLRKLWKTRYPTQNTPPATVVEGLRVAAHFGQQFPEDCQ